MTRLLLLLLMVVTGLFAPAPRAAPPSQRLLETSEGWIAAQAASRDAAVAVIAIDYHDHMDLTRKEILLMDARNGKRLRVFPYPFITIDAVALSPNNRRIAVSGQGWDDAAGQRVSTLVFFDSRSGAVENAVDLGKPRLFNLAFFPDGRQLACFAHAERDDERQTRFGEIQIRDARTGKPLRVIPHDEGAETLAVSPNGKYVASEGTGNRVTVWDAQTSKVVSSLNGHTSVPTGILFSKDNRHVFTTGADGTIRRWNIRSGEQEWSYKTDGIVTALALSADEKTAAFCVLVEEDGEVRLLHLNNDTAQPIGSVFDHGNLLRFAADGKSLLSVDMRQVLRFPVPSSPAK